MSRLRRHPPDQAVERLRRVAAGPPWRVVVIDDDDRFREALVLLLEVDGRFQVAGQATTGDAGVALARALRPQAVVTDLHMPGMDGLAVALELAGTPVLVLTSSPEAADAARRARELGVAIVSKDAMGSVDLFDQLAAAAASGARRAVGRALWRAHPLPLPHRRRGGEDPRQRASGSR